MILWDRPSKYRIRRPDGDHAPNDPARIGRTLRRSGPLARAIATRTLPCASPRRLTVVYASWSPPGDHVSGPPARPRRQTRSGRSGEGALGPALSRRSVPRIRRRRRTNRCRQFAARSPTRQGQSPSWRDASKTCRQDSPARSHRWHNRLKSVGTATRPQSRKRLCGRRATKRPAPEIAIP